MNRKPKKLHAATIKRRALDCAEIAGWLAARSGPISNANEFVDTGVRGTAYDTVKRGGQELTGPEAYASASVSQPDEVGRMAGEFMGTLERWQRDARRLRILAVRLAVDWEASDDNGKSTRGDAASRIAQRAVEPAGAGDCATCGRVVSGASRDRLRHGRCDACRMYWDRNGVERPKALWGSDSTDDRCVAILTRHGTDHRCRGRAGHADDHVFTVEAVA